MKSSGNTYYDKMHRLGKFVTVGSILVFCGVPLVVCLYYGIMPKIGDLLLAAGGLCAIFIPTGVAEAFGEIPVMGSSYYVANVTGNILNLKLPAALNALKVANVKSGTEAADAITGLAVAVSSLVSPAVSTAAGYVLPALFGCLVLSFLSNDVGGGVIVKKRLLAAIFPFALCIILYLIIPDYYDLGQGFVMVICIPIVYVITKIMYKKGIITVEMPEEEKKTEEEHA